MIDPRNWGMPLKITEKDFSWGEYKKAFIDSFLKKKGEQRNEQCYLWRVL